MRSKKILFYLILLLMLPAATLGALEIILRIFDPIGVRYYYDASPYFSIMEPDPDFAYRHRPGFNGVLQGVVYSINSEGLRWREFEKKKKECTARVLVLGDSMVVGWGVEQDRIFPARLQGLFNASGMQVEVISAGVGSWNTRTEYEFFKKKALDYNPDILVMLVESGDVEPKADGNTFMRRGDLFGTVNYLRGSDPAEKLLKRLSGPAAESRLAMTVWHFVMLGTRNNWRAKLYDRNAPTWLDAKAAMIGLLSECRSNNIVPLVYLWGLPEWSEYARASHEAYGELLEQYGVPHRTFTETLYHREYANSIVDTHPNAVGHGIIANAIFNDIKETATSISASCETNEESPGNGD